MGSTVAWEFSTGRITDRAINTLRFFQTKSTVDETQVDIMASKFSLSPARLLMRLELNPEKRWSMESKATFETTSDLSSMLAPMQAHQADTPSRSSTLFWLRVTRSSRATMQPSVSVMENQRLSLGGIEVVGYLLVAVSNEAGKAVGRDGSKDGDGDGSDVEVAEAKDSANAGTDGFPKVKGERLRMG